MERKTKLFFNGEWVAGTLVPVRSSQESWSEYLLEDEAVVRLKVVVTEVYRIEGIYDTEGNPVYHIRSANVASAMPPEHLKRKPEGIS